MDDQISLNFKRSEFACGCGCGFDDISPALVEKLQEFREELGKPIRVTSGCRCAKHNSVFGGAFKSAHLSGLAVDIACGDSPNRMLMLPWACRLFRRVGIAKGFMHFDIDGEKSQDVLWTY